MEIVVADIPERQALRLVRAELNDRRSQIADLDLGIETLREDLHRFEGHYHARIQEEQEAFNRLKKVTGHAERWSRLLYESAKPKKTTTAVRRKKHKAQNFLSSIKRLEQQRQHEADVEQERRSTTLAADTPKVEIAFKRAHRDADLKDAYRTLARRYHPDLARTEDERLQSAHWMRRINQLYHDGDLDRLVALAEQSKGADLDGEDLSIEEQIEALQSRLSWFDLVLENLRGERVDLENSPTFQLMRDVELAGEKGHDLIADTKAQLREEIRHAYNNVREAIITLEQRVRQFNRSRAPGNKLSRQEKKALETSFDPFADKRMIHKALNRGPQETPSKVVSDLRSWLCQEARKDPEPVCLALFTYITELSPFPFDGLSDFGDLAERFRDVVTLALEDLVEPIDGPEQESEAIREPKSLEASLVHVEDLIEYGVKQASPEVAHLGLRFRSTALAEAIPLALQDLHLARMFRDVLEVTGKFTTCTSCDEDIYAVPLYKLRGLDNLHASVCPNCGHTLESYFMPKGEDVQAVLNPTFIEYELVSEWTFRLARASIAVQLVPAQVELMTAGDLKKRLVDDLFTRHELEISRGDVLLLQNEQRVSEKTPLHELIEQNFSVRFHERCTLNETDALELIRHRIRNRFR